MAAAPVVGQGSRSSRSLPELWGTYEVAQALNVSRSNLDAIVDLPEPVQRVKATRLWLAHEIRLFAPVFAERQRTRKSRKD